MDLNYTSAHARVFEGVRTARFRALAESRLDPATYKESCVFSGQNSGDRVNCDVIAAALWVHAPSGNISPLCKYHLDGWLDDGDAAGAEDPPALVPLANRRSRR